MKIKNINPKQIRTNDFIVLHANNKLFSHMKKGDKFDEPNIFGIRHFGDPLGKVHSFFNKSRCIESDNPKTKQWFKIMFMKRAWYQVREKKKGNGSPTITFANIHSGFLIWKAKNGIE